MAQAAQKPEEKCECGGDLEWSRSCGAKVCVKCDNHKGLARCFCGWSKTSPGRGREELEEAGETIDPEEPSDLTNDFEAMFS